MSVLPLADCQSIQATLNTKKEYNAVKVGNNTLTAVDIGSMVKIHQLHKKKTDAAATEKWLDASFKIPSPSCNTPDTKWITEFRDWVWEHEDSNILIYPTTSTKDLLTLCDVGWIELQTISAFLPIINRSTNGRKAFTFSNLVELQEEDLEKTLAKELDNVNEIAFIMHVGKDSRQSYVSSHSLPGNHWSFLTVDLRAGSFQYFDSLCWPVPRNLKKPLERVIKAVAKVRSIEVTIPNYIPSAHPSSGGTHVCNGDCMTNYPIQQCGYVCGAITVLMAAVFVHAPTYWQNVIQSTIQVPSCWLRHPTANSSYIRKVLIAWLMQQRVEMSNLGIQDEQSQEDVTSNDSVLTIKKRNEERSKCKEKTRERREMQSSSERANIPPERVIDLSDSSCDEDISVDQLADLLVKDEEPVKKGHVSIICCMLI